MRDEGKTDSTVLSRRQILAGICSTAAILGLFAGIWLFFDKTALAVCTFAVVDILLGLGLALLGLAAGGLLYRACPAYRRSADAYLLLIVKPLRNPDLIWLGVLPGLSEEILFRGLLIPALGGNAAAVLISGLLFGALHLVGPVRWPYAVWAAVVGFALGAALLVTGNLLTPVVAHIVINTSSAGIWKTRFTTRHD